MEQFANEVIGNNFSAYNVEKQFSYVRPYDPKVTDIPEYRHAVIRYWTTQEMKKKNIAAKPAKMVTVPQVQLPDTFQLPEDAAKVLIGVIEDEQDVLIKEQIDAEVKLIDWNSISIQACFNALTAVRISKRLTKEMIENCAKIAMAEGFKRRAMEICRQANITESDNIAKQIAGTTNAYISRFMNLAAPVPKLDSKELRMLLSMMQSCSLADDMSKALTEKIDVLLNPAILSNDGNL